MSKLLSAMEISKLIILVVFTLHQGPVHSFTYINEEGERVEWLNGQVNLVPRIVKEGYLKMCMGLWDGTDGLRGYLDRLVTCSKLEAIAR